MISDYSPILPSVFGASCRYATDGTHYEGLLMPWRENTCGIRDRGPRILDLRAKKPPISNYPPTIPPTILSLSCQNWSQLSDSNRRPTVYKTVALPLS